MANYLVFSIDLQILASCYILLMLVAVVTKACRDNIFIAIAGNFACLRIVTSNYRITCLHMVAGNLEIWQYFGQLIVR